MPAASNSYCERLQVPVPRVADFVRLPQTKLFDLLVLALLEQGEPMQLEVIAARLVAAGAEATTGDMAYSLKKAWHGMEPVYRDADGRMGLNLSSSEMGRRLWQLGLKKPRFAPAPKAPEVEAVPDDVQLSDAEVRMAFAHSSINSVSAIRRVAAILDACDRPMSVEEIAEYWKASALDQRATGKVDRGLWCKSYGSFDVEERLSLERSAAGVPAMRRAIRKLSSSVQQRQAHETHWRHIAQERQAILEKERQQLQDHAARLRRAVLRVYPECGPTRAAALLDVSAHQVHSFVDGELEELTAMLDSFDLVAGLQVRESLRALGVCDQDRFRLAELKSPQKSRRLNRQGRTLTITPELLMTSTTGISRPLGESAKTAAYLETNNLTKLRKRIMSDVKALFAFYNYGVLHGYVRLRWGFLDEYLPVEWGVPGELNLYEILKSCCGTGAEVDLVCGSAPGWTDPWSRAQTVTVVALEPWSVLVQGDDGRQQLARQEIQAARLATPKPPL